MQRRTKGWFRGAFAPTLSAPGVAPTLCTPGYLGQQLFRKRSSLKFNDRTNSLASRNLPLTLKKISCASRAEKELFIAWLYHKISYLNYICFVFVVDVVPRLSDISIFRCDFMAVLQKLVLLCQGCNSRLKDLAKVIVVFHLNITTHCPFSRCGASLPTSFLTPSLCPFVRP